MSISSSSGTTDANQSETRTRELQILPLSGNFGVEIRNLDIATASDAQLKTLLYALYENRFVVVKTTGIGMNDYVRFANRLGQPIRLSGDPRFPEIAQITNRNVDTRETMMGAAHWHTDQSFRNTVSSITMLYSEHAPERGGETRFCNMADAYKALPSQKKSRIDDLVVIHRHGRSVSAPPNDHTPLPPRGWNQRTTVYHPLVRRHPETGLKTLYAIAGTSQGIKGMPQQAATSLLQELCAHAFQERFITEYRHAFGDIVLWDNPTTMHSATPIAAASGPSDLRLLHRISLRGSPAVFQSSKLATA